MDPSWLFLIEITIFIIPWFAVFTAGRRRGRPAGQAAGIGAAVGLAAAAGVFGLTQVLPNIQINRTPAESSIGAEILPPCEAFLARGSLLPSEGAVGMPPEAEDAGLALSWLPLGSVMDDGQHDDGWIMDDGNHDDGSVMDDGNHDDGFVMDDGNHDDGFVMDDGNHDDGFVMDDGEHGDSIQWQVELLLPTGEILSQVTAEYVIPLSALGVETEWLMDDGNHGDGLVMDDGEHGGRSPCRIRHG